METTTTTMETTFAGQVVTIPPPSLAVLRRWAVKVVHSRQYTPGCLRHFLVYLSPTDKQHQLAVLVTFLYICRQQMVNICTPPSSAAITVANGYAVHIFIFSAFFRFWEDKNTMEISVISERSPSSQISVIIITPTVTFPMIGWNRFSSPRYWGSVTSPQFGYVVVSCCQLLSAVVSCFASQRFGLHIITKLEYGITRKCAFFHFSSRLVCLSSGLSFMICFVVILHPRTYVADEGKYVRDGKL